MSLGIVGNDEAPFTGRAWVRTFPHGEVEVLCRRGAGPGELESMNEWLRDAGIDNRIKRLSPPGYGTPRAERDETPESSAERVMRRAKQKLRWSVKAIGCDQMLTLTYRENLTDYAESRRHLSRFLALCRREWSSWKHVAAPERQVRGAWHWHLGVRGFVNYDKLRGFWWRAMGYRVAFSVEGKPVLLDGGETPGNVQGVASSVRGRRRRSWSSDRLAGYLAKYLSKSVGAEGIDGKSYSVSRGLQWKVERYAIRAFNYADSCGALFDLLAAAGSQGSPFLWSSDCRSILWAAGRSPPVLAPPPSPSS